MSQRIAVYGTYKAKVPVRQRYWKKRRDGIKQRYWKIKRESYKKITGRGRYEFHGKGRDLYKAILTAHRTVPKGYITVAATKFLNQPEKYGFEGTWIDKEVDSL